MLASAGSPAEAAGGDTVILVHGMGRTKRSMARLAGQLSRQGFHAANELGPVTFPLGVITGNRSLNPLFSAWLAGPNDGKVSVTRSQVEGMTDFLVVPRSHTYIMRSSQVISQVARFLQRGNFNHTPA